MKIPITRVSLGSKEEEAVLSVLRSGWLVQGSQVSRFEQMFASFTGARHAVAVTSCTTALHLALDILGIRPGDRVLIPSLTYVASANAVEQMGAVPVLCDIDLATFNIDTTKLHQYSNISCVMPVNLFGLCADLPAVQAQAAEWKATVLEDSACGFDAWLNGKHSGTFGDIGCFSFHPRKAVTTGEGGMLVTNSDALAALARCKRDHGAAKSDLARHYEKGGSLLPDFPECGYNYRMTDMQGAMGVVQMERAPELMQMRRAVAQKYDEALVGLPLVRPEAAAGYTHGYQSYVTLYTGGLPLAEVAEMTIPQIDELNRKRNIAMLKLEEMGVATRQGTHAVHTLSYYKEKYQLPPESCKNAYAADRLSVSLPVFPTMTDEEFRYVIDRLGEVF